MRGTPCQLGQEGQGQYQHAHAADPVGEGTPEHEPTGEEVKVTQNGCASGGEAGYGFKQRIGKVGNHAAEHKGEGTEDAQNDPSQGYNQEAFPGTQIPVFRFGQAAHGQPQHHHNAHGFHKGHSVPIPVDERQNQGRHHAGCFQQKDCA